MFQNFLQSLMGNQGDDEEKKTVVRSPQKSRREPIRKSYQDPDDKKDKESNKKKTALSPVKAQQKAVGELLSVNKEDNYKTLFQDPKKKRESTPNLGLIKLQRMVAEHEAKTGYPDTELSKMIQKDLKAMSKRSGGGDAPPPSGKKTKHRKGTGPAASDEEFAAFMAGAGFAQQVRSPESKQSKATAERAPAAPDELGVVDQWVEAQVAQNEFLGNMFKQEEDLVSANFETAQKAEAHEQQLILNNQKMADNTAKSEQTELKSQQDKLKVERERAELGLGPTFDDEFGEQSSLFDRTIGGTQSVAADQMSADLLPTLNPVEQRRHLALREQIREGGMSPTDLQKAMIPTLAEQLSSIQSETASQLEDTLSEGITGKGRQARKIAALNSVLSSTSPMTRALASQEQGDRAYELSLAKFRQSGMGRVPVKNAAEARETVMMANNLMQTINDGQFDTSVPVPEFVTMSPMSKGFNLYQDMIAKIDSGADPTQAMKETAPALKEQMDMFLESGGTPEDFTQALSALSEGIATKYNIPLNQMNGALAGKDLLQNSVGNMVRSHMAQYSKFGKQYLEEEFGRQTDLRVKEMSPANKAAQEAYDFSRAMGSNIDPRPSYGIRSLGSNGLGTPVRTFEEAFEAHRQGIFKSNHLFDSELKRRGLNASRNKRSPNLLGGALKAVGHAFHVGQ